MRRTEAQLTMPQPIGDAADTRAATAALSTTLGRSTDATRERVSDAEEESAEKPRSKGNFESL